MTNKVITFEETGNIHPALLSTEPITITANIGGVEIEDLLIDGGIACDILPWNTFKQMGVSHFVMKEGGGYLRGITGHDTPILGVVKLPMTLGYWPRCARHMVEFLVADVPTGHNGVIGRLSKLLSELRFQSDTE